jgi:hypothetical protein
VYVALVRGAGEIVLAIAHQFPMYMKLHHLLLNL